MYMVNANTFKENLLFSNKGELQSSSIINGKIYVVMRDKDYLDLYVYDFEDKKMNVINHVKNHSDDLSSTVNIWEKNNVVNWDIIIGEELYRYQSEL